MEDTVASKTFDDQRTADQTFPYQCPTKRAPSPYPKLQETRSNQRSRGEDIAKGADKRPTINDSWRNKANTNFKAQKMQIGRHKENVPSDQIPAEEHLFVVRRRDLPVAGVKPAD